MRYTPGYTYRYTLRYTMGVLEVYVEGRMMKVITFMIIDPTVHDAI